ncbi:type II restriction enzyme [Sutcliffiella cohnii]
MTKKSPVKREKDIIWEELFYKYNLQNKIDDIGYARITSDEINSLKPGVQARLQAKFDNSTQLPPIFQQQKLGLLPIANGVYHIGKFDIFKKFEIELDKVPLTFLKANLPLETVTYDGDKSESNALHTARISGVFSHYYNNKVELTQSGRMRATQAFDFKVNNIPLTVKGDQQAEVDALLESKNEIVVVEAKNGKPIDFNIRQLYYPMRIIQTRYNVRKPIKPLYYLYSGDTHYLLEYKFSNSLIYDSLEFVKAHAYRIEEEALSDERLMYLLNSTPIIQEDPNGIFPQANSITRVIDLMEWMYRIETDTLEEHEQDDQIFRFTGINHKNIAKRYGFNIRQGQYYATTLVYLGFATRTIFGRNGQFVYSLTSNALKYINSSKNEKIDIMLKAWFAHKPIRELILACLRAEKQLPREQAVMILVDNGAYIDPVTSTGPRRADGVLGWFRWLSNIMQRH